MFDRNKIDHVNVIDMNDGCRYSTSFPNNHVKDYRVNLAEILSGIAGVASEYNTVAPEGWGQGRALHGGVAASLGLRAAKSALPDLPPLRSAQTVFLAPAVGKLRIVPTALRRGRSSSFVGVDCFSDAQLAFRLTLAFGADRKSDVAYDRIPMPEVAAPDACEPFTWPGMPGGFFDHFELRQAGSATVGTLSPKDELHVWVRFKADSGLDGENALLAIGDVLPPASLVSCRERAPISTMSWSIDFHQPAITSEWYLLRSIGDQAGGGYSRQSMCCWASDGRCLTISRQTVAIFF